MGGGGGGAVRHIYKKCNMCDNNARDEGNAGA